MKGIEDFLGSAQWSHNIQKSLGLSWQLSALYNPQEHIAKSLSAVNMINDFAKNINQSSAFAQSSLSILNSLKKTMSWQSELTITQTALNSIISLNRQQQELFGPLKKISETISNHQKVLSQINNWQFAMSNFSVELAAVAARQEKWDLIDDFEEITADVSSFNERIFNEDSITRADLDELKELFQRIEVKINKIDSKAKSLFWNFLAVLSFILTAYSVVKDFLPKPEFATRLEVETIIKKQYSLFESKLQEENEFRVTNRECKVMSKPTLRSLVVEKLPVDFKITVLQIRHKWVYVSYSSPKDSLPNTGWVLKKYLVKPL